MPDTLPDLVQRLRDRAARKWTDEANRSASLFGQVADEIERLRSELGALRAQVLEEAAEVAEAYLDGAGGSAHSCVTAIRALKDKTNG